MYKLFHIMNTALAKYKSIFYGDKVISKEINKL